MTANPSGDSSLIQRVRRGDHRALQRLIYDVGTRAEPDIQKKIPAKYRSKVSAEDVVQIARTKAVQQLSKCDALDDEQFYWWFSRIALNTLYSELRHLGAQKRGGSKHMEKEVHEVAELSARGDSPQRQLEQEEVLHAVKSGLDELPTTQRNVVRLYHLNSFSVAKTAEQLGHSPGRVRNLLKQATERMRRLLGDSTNWFSR